MNTEMEAYSAWKSIADVIRDQPESTFAGFMVGYQARATTDREEVKRLREGLRRIGLAQSRMLDKWADGDKAVKDALWKELHDCEDEWRALLSESESEQKEGV